MAIYHPTLTASHVACLWGCRTTAAPFLFAFPSIFMSLLLYIRPYFFQLSAPFLSFGYRLFFFTTFCGSPIMSSFKFLSGILAVTYADHYFILVCFSVGSRTEKRKPSESFNWVYWLFVMWQNMQYNRVKVVTENAQWNLNLTCMANFYLPRWTWHLTYSLIIMFSPSSTLHRHSNKIFIYIYIYGV